MTDRIAFIVATENEGLENAGTDCNKWKTQDGLSVHSQSEFFLSRLDAAVRRTRAPLVKRNIQNVQLQNSDTFVRSRIFQFHVFSISHSYDP